MNTRNYRLDDLQVLSELSDNSFLCFSFEQEWKLIWHNDCFIKECGYQEIDNFSLNIVVARLKQVYERKETYIILYDQKHNELWYRISYEHILLEHQDCILFRMTWINDVAKDEKLKKINKSRTNNVPCGIFCVHIEQGKLHCVYNNTYFYKMLGYEESELDKDDLLTARIIYPADFAGFQSEVLSHIEKHDPLFELEYRIMKKDGTLCWVMARVVPDILENHYLAIVLDNTKQKEIMNQLRISEEEKRIALRQGNLMILRYDIKSKTLCITDQGAHSDEKYKIIRNMPDTAVDKNLVSEDTMKEFMSFFHDMQMGKPSGEAVFRQMVFPSKEMRWIKARFTMIYNDYKEPETAIISYEDYTDFHEKEMAFEKWKVDFDHKKRETIAYYEYDITRDRFETLEGKLADALPQAERKSFTYIAHYSADHFVSHRDRKKYLKVFSREFLLAQYEKGERMVSLKHRRLNEQGEEYWALGEVRLILDPYTNDVKASVLIYDINEEMRKNIELQKLSQTDSLTGLYNRTSLFRRMENTLEHSGQLVMHVMILIDLDHFKELNDTYGHQYGDLCLINVANAMRSVCRGGDICSRIGGDEFVIFIRNMPLSTDISSKLEDLLRAINAKDGYGRSLNASIGVASYPVDGQDVSTLYHLADEALYQAKNMGRNRYHIFCKKNEGIN